MSAIYEPKTLVIREPDLKKVTASLSSFPGPVKHATLTFLADGLEHPWRTERYTEYFTMCEARGIIPGTLYFETDRYSGAIVPERRSEDIIERYEDMAWTQRAVALAIGPGRMREQRFKLQGNFGRFQEQLLPSLVANEYQVGEADIGLTWYYSKHGCYDDGGYNYSSSLKITRGGVKLCLDDNERVDEPLAEKQRKELKRWFRGLGTVTTK